MKSSSSRSTGGWRPTLTEIFLGAAAGAVASIPMAWVMGGLFKLLPKREQYALPPEEITVEVAARTGSLGTLQSPKTRRAATWLGHIGYGAAAASLFPLLTRALPLPGAARGVLFATMVYALSYLGWLPALGILPPATQMPIRRTLVMIFSHWVWGGITGAIVHKMEMK